MQDAPTVDYVARFGCGNQNVSENLDFRYCIGPRSPRFSQKQKAAGNQSKIGGICTSCPQLQICWNLPGLLQERNRSIPTEELRQGKWVGRLGFGKMNKLFDELMGLKEIGAMLLN